MPAWLGSDESSPPGLQIAALACPHMVEREGGMGESEGREEKEGEREHALSVPFS